MTGRVRGSLADSLSTDLYGSGNTDATLRKRASKLTTARVSFRDRVLEKVDVCRRLSSRHCADILFKSMSLQYQEAVDELGKTLHLFAGKQQ